MQVDDELVKVEQKYNLGTRPSDKLIVLIRPNSDVSTSNVLNVAPKEVVLSSLTI